MRTPETMPAAALIAATFDIDVGLDEERDRVLWAATREPAAFTTGAGKSRMSVVLFGVFAMREADVLACLRDGVWPDDAAPLPLSKVDHGQYRVAQDRLVRSTQRIERAAVQRAAKADLGCSGVRHAS